MKAGIKRLSTAALSACFVWAGFWAAPAAGAGTLKPFVAAAPAGNTMEEAVKNVKAKLKQGQFEIVGEDSPSDY